MKNIRQAVILAAGIGSRLKGVVDDKPKGFLKLGEKPIIEESIAKLVRSGVTDIVIVSGYRHDYYDELTKKYPFVTTVKNPDFAVTGSMYSFYMARERIRGDILLLESDLIYEYDVLQVLQNSVYSDSILVSGRTGSGDEVYVGVDGDRIVCLSKDIQKNKRLGGELVGISRISLDLYREMVGLAKDMFDTSPLYDYEDCLTDLCGHRIINYDFAEKPAWMEIDDENHYKKALDTVYPLIQERDKAISIKKNVERTVLLNPGPAATSDSVKYAMVVEDICPREKEFGKLVQGIRRDLVRIVHGRDLYEAVLFASSGTGGIEACLTSVVPDDRAVFIIINGAYGERMQQICDGFGIMHIDYVIDWGEPIDFKKVETIIIENKDAISHIAMVHHETTVGILNDLSSVSDLASKYGMELIVDAVSSFAGIPIDVTKLGIHYLVSSSNKCIQGMAGVGFAICNIESLEKTASLKPRNFYFNLYQNYMFFSKKREMQFTPPVQILYALRQAINEYFIETEEGRADRYAHMYKVLTAGLKRLGFKFLVEEKFHAKILTAIIEPRDPNYDFTEMHDFLIQRGFTIYPGKGAKEDSFRIANMGAISYDDIEEFLENLEAYLTLKNIKLS
ncbi:MAG: 2-aminoethylphosphonate--pyruvate transaminase [Deltaproteobacteria bacterium]|nr:2-aminoethylphosphonate--pyruvate transaminase [Deltaproteobacteria bacterium]